MLKDNFEICWCVSADMVYFIASYHKFIGRKQFLKWCSVVVGYLKEALYIFGQN